jgi:hypothetical protein
MARRKTTTRRTRRPSKPAKRTRQQAQGGISPFLWLAAAGGVIGLVALASRRQIEPELDFMDLPAPAPSSSAGPETQDQTTRYVEKAQDYWDRYGDRAQSYWDRYIRGK